ncbi:MAG TPA: tetratricopeptide repeat protein [Vicinamibacteria bacterium]|nr:tetratricopeptide repeat protein [Vicinamibacteria bacterium]
MKKAAAAALAAALAAAPAAAQESAAVAKLENGTSIGFALVRTGAEGPSGAIGEAALPRSNSVSRVLWDRESGAYFGYRVEVERRDGPRPFKVAFKPLDHSAVERELKSRGDCPGCPAPAPLGSGPQFPAAQQLGEGEALTLELLANPTTGERILDVVKLSGRPIEAEVMRTAASRVLEAQQVIRRADLHAVRKRYAQAAEEYRGALELQPNDASVHHRLGICYQMLNNDAMARREYARALELKPGYAEVWNNIGSLEQSRKHFKEAVRAYRKAIEIKPTLSTPWKNLGNAYFAQGRLQEGFEAYQEAFRLDPSILENQGPSIPAEGVDAATQYFFTAKLLAASGKKDAALESLRKAKLAGFHDWAKVESDAAFKELVKDPRYQELAEAK